MDAKLTGARFGLHLYNTQTREKGLDGPLTLFSLSVESSSCVDAGETCSGAAVDQGQATVPLNTSDQLGLSEAFAEFADVHATVLDAGEVLAAEGDNVEVLSLRRSVEDRSVLVVAIKLKQGQAHVGGLLVAELRTSDFDLAVVTSLLGQRTAHRLGANDVLAAALGVNVIDHFVELAEVQSTATVGEVL